MTQNQPREKTMHNAKFIRNRFGSKGLALALIISSSLLALGLGLLLLT
jgi:hypothetical protein